MNRKRVEKLSEELEEQKNRRHGYVLVLMLITATKDNSVERQEKCLRLEKYKRPG